MCSVSERQLIARPTYIAITPYFPTPNEPWRCSFLSDQVKAIERNSEHNVLVINPESDISYDLHGIRVIGFRQIKKGRWVLPFLVDSLNARRMWRKLSAEKIELSNVEVVHGHLSPCAPYVLALAKRLPNTKKILQFHDPDPYGMMFNTGKFGRFKQIVYFLYYRKLIQKMDMLVCISENVKRVVLEAPRQTVFRTYRPMAKAMKDLAWFKPCKIGRDKTYVLHNGVDAGVFKRSNRGRPSLREFSIGCVAVFRDWKDQLTLLRSIDTIRDSIPELKVRLVGVKHSGTMLEDCKAFIREHDLPVNIIPSFSHNELTEFYQSLDLFVLPSYFEGFGCVFTEAWSCGTPFITCEGQGMDDFIYPEDRSLWLCKEQDPDDLAKKILYFYHNRPHQRLALETDIDKLVPKFLEEVCKLKTT